MTSTAVRNSRVGDAWIMKMCELNPPQRVLDKDGNPTGNILTGPVRLAFVNLLKPSQQKNDDGTMREGKYNTIALFTPFFDPTLFYEAYYAECAKSWADMYDAGTQQYYGLHSPFRDQAEKFKFAGFTPRCTFMTFNSQFKPPIVDTANNPIVDERRVYPGVWAILSVNAYSYGKNPPRPKKGVGFGLQSVMIVGDDENTGGGGAVDPRTQFGAVKAAAPMAAPVAAFAPAGGMTAPAGAPPVTGSLYGQGPGFVPQTPGQGAMPPYAPPMAPAFAPAAPGFAPPPADEDLSQFFQ
jgi:hypothetical protein